MYSIGQFSLILKVSTRTLRHYDEIGLLKPSFVSKENNYRYYEKEQINSAKYIIKLKESGLGLEEIKDIIIVMKEEICVISKRVRINIRNVGEIIGLLYEEINKHGLKIAGGHIIKYYDLEYDSDNADVEVSIPMEKRKESKVKLLGNSRGKYFCIV